MSETTPDNESPQHGASSSRMLACVRCQKSKIKCDRTMPCSNCVKRNTQCVPGTAIAPKQRRKRFPERELLEKVRRYEGLLRKHNIDFEPLHKDDGTGQTSSKTTWRQPKASISDSEDEVTDDEKTVVSILPREGATLVLHRLLVHR